MVLSHQMERSVLNGPERDTLVPYMIGGRRRLATCSGVAWFRGYHLAVVNVYGGHLRVYRFHPGGEHEGTPRLELLHDMRRGVHCPEDVAVSGDGCLAAVTHSLSDDLGVTLHRLDPVSLEPDPDGENLRHGRLGSAFHGVSFSPDSRHLALCDIGNPGYVEVMHVESRQSACVLENRYAPLKPKGIAFSPDGRFFAIAGGFNGRPDGASPAGGFLSIHRFHAAEGVIDGEALARYDGPEEILPCPELAAFLPLSSGKRHTLLLCDQTADAVRTFEFDQDRGSLAYVGDFATGLSFPHGLAVSADGRFAAITNYGDDTVRIARVPR